VHTKKAQANGGGHDQHRNKEDDLVLQWARGDVEEDGVDGHGAEEEAEQHDDAEPDSYESTNLIRSNLDQRYWANDGQRSDAQARDNASGVQGSRITRRHGGNELANDVNGHVESH
jgi:hypothetical protein